MPPAHVVDRGDGPPLLLIPGIQGRWEWMEPAVQALSRHHRVLSFSLDDVPEEGFFDNCIRRIDEILAARTITSVDIAGVSFGGLIAALYAARRPATTGRLVLVSAPSPGWKLDPRSRSYARRPRLSLPLFAIRGMLRLGPEILAAQPGWMARGAFAAGYLSRAARAPVSPTRMSSWVRTWMASDLAAEFAAITAPTLLITGEPRLDRVVPVSSSLEYLDLIPGARHVVLDRTGHIGLVLRPRAFADIVSGFLDASGRAPSDGRNDSVPAGAASAT